VAGQLRLGNLGEMRAVRAELIGRDPCQRVFGRMRDFAAAASGVGPLEQRRTEAISGGSHREASAMPGRPS